MMKKLYMILCVLILLLVFPFFKVEAGTFLVGAKCWYETNWDSAMLNIIDDLFADQFSKVGVYNIQSDTHAGSGYLAGPVLGFQTSDNIWSFSFAPMVVSHFSQKIIITYLADLNLGGILFPVQGNGRVAIDVTRRDYDLAASYSLHPYKDKFSFLEYCKVFLGLKYESISYDFNITTRVATLEDTGTIGFDFEIYMPTVGVGFVYPFTEEIAAGIQGGVGVAYFSGIDVDNSMAYNVEANLSISPRDNLILQLGYRYQEFSFDLNYSDPDFDLDKTYKSTDTTYGPTVTVIYTF